MLGLIAPLYSNAANYCIAAGGGFGSGGTTYIGPGFVLPLAGKCKPWSGYTKTASSVVLVTTGTGCLSSDSKVLTFSMSSTDPGFLSPGVAASDYIQFCPPGTKSCPVAASDQGNFGGSAAPTTCTAALLKLPSTHD
jgi:hypothetical protein